MKYELRFTKYDLGEFGKEMEVYMLELRNI